MPELNDIQRQINNIKIYEQKYTRDHCDVETSKKYYRGENTRIMSRKLQFVHEGALVEDLYKSNEKIAENDYRTIVDQLTGYLFGKQPSLEDVPEDILRELPQKKMWKVTKQSLKKCQIQKKAWVQVYIKDQGDEQMVDFALVEESNGILPIYSNGPDGELTDLIKYYMVDVLDKNGDIKQRTRYEYWDKETVTYYQTDNNGKIYLIAECEEIPYNPRPHIIKEMEYDGGVSKVVEVNSWGRVPFIELPFNEENQTALQMIGKNKVDGLDILMSDGVNNFVDMADAIYILKDYIGKPEEALYNLKTKKAAVVRGDGDVSQINNEIPMVSRKEMITLLRGAIYKDGQGVDLSNLTGGNITNVVIKAYYEALNTKANNIIPELSEFINEMIYYVDLFKNNYDLNAVDMPEYKVAFTKNVIINEIEYINASNQSAGFISDQTRWSFDPRVDDATQEAERVEAENEGLD